MGESLLEYSSVFLKSEVTGKILCIWDWDGTGFTGPQMSAALEFPPQFSIEVYYTGVTSTGLCFWWLLRLLHVRVHSGYLLCSRAKSGQRSCLHTSNVRGDSFVMCQVCGHLWYMSLQMFQQPLGETHAGTKSLTCSLVWFKSYPNMRLILPFTKSPLSPQAKIPTRIDLLKWCFHAGTRQSVIQYSRFILSRYLHGYMYETIYLLYVCVFLHAFFFFSIKIT